MHGKRTLGIAAVLIGLAPAAFAHITAKPDSAVAGSYFNTEFMVPHGCDGSATVAIRIKIPEGVTGVKPQLKAGWTVTIKTRKLDAPQKSEHGRTVSETVDEVDWRGGPLPDSLYDTFGMVMKLPDGAGQTLSFPVVQECQQGTQHWIDIPTEGQRWHDLRNPAPFVKLTPKTP